MRALVQGLDTRASWERYLKLEGEHADARAIRRTIEWIRREFAAAARREQRFGVARLVALEISRIPAPAAPPLEAFAAERGLTGFGVNDQLEAYRETFGRGALPRARRG